LQHPRFQFRAEWRSRESYPGEWFLFIGEDNREPGCTTKGHTTRYAPLHPEIVKRLIPFMEKQVAEHGHGPLFRHLPKDKNGKRSTYVARKIDEWMDGVIKDPNLAPNHSFRHYLKSELLARDVPERISDAITGHTRLGQPDGISPSRMAEMLEVDKAGPKVRC
jgi:integrase